MEKFSNGAKNTLVTFSIIGAFFLGIYVDNNNRPEIEKVLGISDKETAVVTTTDFSPFWKVWNTINEKYPKTFRTKIGQKWGKKKQSVNDVQFFYTSEFSGTLSFTPSNKNGIFLLKYSLGSISLS